MTNGEFIAILRSKLACYDGVEWYRKFSKKTKKGLRENLARIRRDVQKDVRDLADTTFIPTSTWGPKPCSKVTCYYTWLMLSVTRDAFIRVGAKQFRKALEEWPADRIIDELGG